MTTTFSTRTTNPHIKVLESVFQSAARPIEWFVIAHNEPRMLTSLSSAFGGESAAILEVSQVAWDFQGQRLQETIEWALHRGEIENLLLVGNSEAGSSESRAALVASGPTQIAQDSDGSDARLFAGVHRSIVRNRDAQERFAAQVKHMLQIPVVHDRWSNGRLNVHGLLYRVDGGFFLAYDSAADTFQPLIS